MEWQKLTLTKLQHKGLQRVITIINHFKQNSRIIENYRSREKKVTFFRSEKLVEIQFWTTNIITK